MPESPFMTDGSEFERRAFERGADDLAGEELDGDDEELDEEELEDDDDELDEDDDELDEDEDEDEDDEDLDEDDELDEDDDELDEDEDEDDDELEDEADSRKLTVAGGAAARGAAVADELGAPGNRAEGGSARAVLEHIARSIVDEPEAVVVEVGPARSGVKLSLHVAPGDMGRIIGRRGRVAQAMRTVVRAAAASEGGDAVVDIVD
jgi:predicted RNA-binding protein YlqC (UPF0109 family)